MSHFLCHIKRAVASPRRDNRKSNAPGSCRIGKKSWGKPGLMARRSFAWKSTVGLIAILRSAEKYHAIPQNFGRLSSRHALDAADPVHRERAPRAERPHA